MRRREGIALGVLLVLLMAGLAPGLQRPDQVVLISWPDRPPSGELTPRLDGMAPEATHAARADGPSVVETLAEEASRSGWVVVEGRGGPEAVMDGALDALVETRRVVVLLRLDGEDRAAIDDQFGRSLDGLAAILAPARTLYVIERPDEVYALGPGQRKLGTPVDGISARRDFGWLLRLR